jgi:hypothetical protein
MSAFVSLHRRALLGVLLISVLAIAETLNAQTAPRRPTLDEILGEDGPAEPVVPSSGNERMNPFLRTDLIVFKLAIFMGLSLMVYCGVVIGFNGALEKGRPPLPAFFHFNRIFLLSVLLLAFVCFGEYTYRGKAVNVAGWIAHFSRMNWFFWAAVTAFTALLLFVSERHER